MIRASVIICVYTEDRWDDIRDAVDSVRGQHAGARGNPRRGPQPRPPSQAQGRLPGHDRGGEHPRAGAVRRPEHRRRHRPGDVVAFLDDDAVAEPGWLAALAERLRDPDVDGVGGLTRPLWATGARPRWFPEEFDWAVGCTYRGMPTRTRPIRNVMGGNAAFRREVVGEVGGFSTAIGRNVQGRKARPLGCEETEFCIRLTQRRPGAVLMFEPGAVIGHKVPGRPGRLAYFAPAATPRACRRRWSRTASGPGTGWPASGTTRSRHCRAGVLRGLRDAVARRSGRARPGGRDRDRARLRPSGATPWAPRGMRARSGRG